MATSLPENHRATIGTDPQAGVPNIGPLWAGFNPVDLIQKKTG
jgi:hypothetical protein